MAYTLDQLTQMGAKPVTSTAPSSSKKSYTADELTKLGAKPVSGDVPEPSFGQKAANFAGGVVNFINNNPVSKAITSLAALPVQLGAKALGQPDPYAKGIGTGVGPIKPAETTTYTDKPGSQFATEELGNAAQVASLFFPYGRAAKAVSEFAAPVLGAGKIAKYTGNIASGLAGGYGVDVASNLQEGKQGSEAFSPGAGTVIGGAIPLVPPVLGAVARGAGESLGISTGAGYGAIKEAFQASSAGGDRAKAFTEALRGKTPPEAIVNDAKDALGTMISDRTKAYQEQLGKVAADNTKSFDISPVQTKLNDLLSDFNVSKTDTGALDYSRSPGLGRFKSDIQDLQDVLKDWGSKPGDRTVIGIDRLKQTIDDFRRGSADSVKFDKFVTALRNSAKDIIKNEPGYSKLVNDYSESTGVIKDVQKALSLGDKASIDTGFRKLTTALRTNNEFRKELIDELDKASGGFLSSKVAGQQLSEALPRGLARQIEGFGALGIGVTGGVGALLPLLKFAAFASPRVVGEIVNALGISKRVFTQLLDRLGASEAQFPGDRADVVGTTQKYLKEHPPSLGLSMKDINKMSPEERGALPNQGVLPNSPKALGGAPKTPETFEGFKDITTTLLDDLKGRSSVSKQYVLDALNRSDIKQAERDAFTSALDTQPNKSLNVKEFADAVKTQLLPLERTDFAAALGGGKRYENIALPDEIRGSVENYGEHVYQSPIKTSAGNTHFNYGEKKADNYFAHTRTEDLESTAMDQGRMGELRKKNVIPGGTTDAEIEEFYKLKDAADLSPKTRRVIEIQSDLFQKGNLDREVGDEFALMSPNENRAMLAGRLGGEEGISRALKARAGEVGKLKPYENTWQDRIVREEVKQAAKDGITKLQFPTGDTAMRVEGLAGDVGHVPQNAAIGDTFEYADETYRVLRKYGDGSYEVTPDAAVTNQFDYAQAIDEEIDNLASDFKSEAEDGDITRLRELPAAFTKGFKKAVKEADKVGGKEPIANYLNEQDDVIRTAAEKDIKGRYSSPEDFAEQWTEETGQPYYAGDDGTIYVLDEGGHTETMQSGSGELDIDKDNPIYKFYEGDVRKFLQKKYLARKISDENGVTWYEVDVPKEAADQPIKAFGFVPPLIAAGAGAGTLSQQPQPLQK